MLGYLDNVLILQAKYSFIIEAEVWNLLVSDDGRQKPLSKRNIAEWVRHDNPEIFCDYKMLRGYKRNQQMVDLDYVPDTIKEEILETYTTYNGTEEKRKYLLGYFMEKRLKHLMEHLDEF